MASVLEYMELTDANGWFELQRCEQARHSLGKILEQELMQVFRLDAVLQERMSALEQRVVAGEMTTSTAVRELIALFAARMAAGEAG